MAEEQRTHKGLAMIEAGTIIIDGPASGYKITRDLRPGDPLYPDCFEPFGGAEEPVAFEVMPQAIIDFFNARRTNG